MQRKTLKDYKCLNIDKEDSTLMRKHILKLIEKYLEASAFYVDSFALPFGRKKQEDYVRMMYRKANEARRLVNLPAKKFKRITSIGIIEEIT